MSGRRVAVLCDFVEEHWPSMDFVGEAIVDSLRTQSDASVFPVRICPPMIRRFSRDASSAWAASTADRALNRFWDYPRLARRIRASADVFHVVDHSYAQLVHELPSSRTLVSCHDVDAFRCLIHPTDEPRSSLIRLMARRTLTGLQKAARVCCDSQATRTALIASGAADEDRISVIPLPVHPTFSPKPDPQADEDAAHLLAGAGTPVDILHVGATVRRKRIDVLLKVVARLRDHVPRLRLIRVGGSFTRDQERLLAHLNLSAHVRILPRLNRRTLAAVYRRAALALLTSDREGFGLTVLEALASGTPAVTSDVPALREIGDDAVSYCPIGDVPVWADRVASLLDERRLQPTAWSRRRERGLLHAQRFNYQAFARRLTALYSTLG